MSCNFFSKFLLFFILIAQFGCSNDTQNEKKEVSDAQKNKISLPDGLTVFRQNCVNCHGNNGKLGLNGAKDLTICQLSAPERILVITNGRNLMTPWKGILSEAEISAVAEYTCTLKP
jgi:cytochrome c6